MDNIKQLINTNELEKEEESKKAQSKKTEEDKGLDQGIRFVEEDLKKRMEELQMKSMLNLPENRRLTHMNRYKMTQKKEKVELKEMRGYLQKKSPSFFGGWQVA